MNKLTAGQLLMINRKLTKNVGEIDRKTRIVIDEIVQMPYEQNEMSMYKYKGLVSKASKLGCAIARIRPFDQKNNQTAVVAVLALLELNNVKLVDYEDKIAQLVEYFVAGDFESGCEWIRERRADSDVAELKEL